MRVVIDIEANGLENPTKVWLVVCKDIDTGQLYVFRRPSDDEKEKERFLVFASGVKTWIGHNVLDYDFRVLASLLSLTVDRSKVIDTLILSRLIDYSRPKGHSIEAYGEEFGLAKGKFNDFSKYSQEMEDYCVRDVEICNLVYNRYLKCIADPDWADAIKMEHEFQEVVNSLHSNGFAFNVSSANKLLDKVTEELKELDDKILRQFPERLKPIREIHPKETKHGTLSRTDFRWVKGGDISDYNGGPFTRCQWVCFNPASHKQIIDVLTDAGWKPVDKTKAHVEAERTKNLLQRKKEPSTRLQYEDTCAKLKTLEKYGWKINENNLDTLPSYAPSSAKFLAKRILLESRRRTLTEWLGLVATKTNRIHGKFLGIGAWTHRMAHQKPNTANIPGEFKLDGSKKLYGKEMRQLWIAPKKRLLVGVDAEGIQLRVFAHYIDDPEFTRALVEGRKDDKSDPHSLNQRILGSVCKSRASAKRFIYALLLGAGIGKLAEILECSPEEAREALSRLSERYRGFATLKSDVLPRDGKRGYFIGLDGRKVPIPGETASARTHLAMSGYLQNGEAIIMKRACLKWHSMLEGVDQKIVNFVHDEWQTEVSNDFTLALKIAKVQSDSLRLVGEELGLKCPLAGSYWNDDHKDYTIGVNWYQTH